ncbi:MAG: methyltransferase domain-containing protein [Isosphaeraceae bacterium]|nr:methyltransferase domain-containing protein [Isosphaeraceae bacterium]
MSPIDESEAQALPVGFRDVDGAPLDKILHCLNTLAHLDGVRRYKDFALQRLELRPGQEALDVACGLGDDVAAMAEACGRATGFDAAASLLHAAAKRHASEKCRFSKGDAHALPFPDDVFDAVRIDRSLQHIARPDLVVREMVRTAKPGGRVLCAEPDWGTFLIGGPHDAVVERIEHDWIRSFRNPWIGRELSSLLRLAGIAKPRVEGFWLPTFGFADSDTLFEIELGARRLAETDPSAAKWLELWKSGEAYAGVLIVVAWGEKSDPSAATPVQR